MNDSAPVRTPPIELEALRAQVDAQRQIADHLAAIRHEVEVTRHQTRAIRVLLEVMLALVLIAGLLTLCGLLIPT